MSAWDDATEDEAVHSPFPHTAVRADNGETAEPLDAQVDRLARFIQENFGSSIRGEGAVDTAIELLHEKLMTPMPALGVNLNTLSDWMIEHHRDLHSQTVAKAGEYGALDLRIMGAALAEVVPNLGEDALPASKLQAAIAFYLLGKVSRVLSALAEGKPAPTDSWLDAEVYSMMGAYVQEYGQWP